MHKFAQLRMIDYDKLFYSDGSATVIPCGSLTLGSKNHVEETRQLFFQNDSNNLSHISSCECGNLVGNFYEGVTCKICKTKVKTNFARILNFDLGWRFQSLHHQYYIQ